MDQGQPGPAFTAGAEAAARGEADATALQQLGAGRLRMETLLGGRFRQWLRT